METTKLIIKKSTRPVGGHSDVFLVIHKSNPAYQLLITKNAKNWSEAIGLNRPINIVCDFDKLQGSLDLERPDEFMKCLRNDVRVIGYVTDEEIDERYKTPLHGCKVMGQDLELKVAAYNENYKNNIFKRLDDLEQTCEDLKKELLTLKNKQDEKPNEIDISSDSNFS